MCVRAVFKNDLRIFDALAVVRMELLSAEVLGTLSYSMNWLHLVDVIVPHKKKIF